MRAVGRAAVSGDPYLLRGLLVCVRCGRSMVAICTTEGERAYGCGPGCDQPDVAAEPAESDMLLGALIRCAVMRHPELGRTEPAWSDGDHLRPVVSVQELCRWQRCDVHNRRALLLVAYSRVLVNSAGKLRPVWRHCADQPARALTGAGA